MIETLGTDREQPGAPNAALAEYHAHLEQRYGMRCELLRTDYRFGSAELAAESMEFFFGPALAARVRARGSEIVPEWTGLWWAEC